MSRSWKILVEKPNYTVWLISTAKQHILWLGSTFCRPWNIADTSN